VRGGRGLGWSAGRVRSVRVRGGSGQNFSNSYGCGAGAVKKIQPAQDSSIYGIFKPSDSDTKKQLGL